MTGVDERVRRALGGLPGPSPQAGRRAERAALDALPAPPRRRARRWALAAAAATVAIAATGAALAATDRLDVRLGAPEARAPEPAAAVPAGEVNLPAGARGLALVAGGRLWLATREGLGVQGLAASAAELSPNASFAAVGIGRSLVAVAPGGRRAWTLATAGPVVGVAWAPNPIHIAYVVRRGAGHELRMVEGDGDRDRLVDADVAPVRPSWRADSAAVAYVGSDGAPRAAAPDGGGPAAVPAPAGRVAALAYAPAGERLALGRADGVAVALRGGPGPAGGWAPLAPRGRTAALAWAAPGDLLAAGDDARPAVPARLWRLADGGGPAGKALAAAPSPAPIAALAPVGDEGRLAVAVRQGEEVQVWEVAAPGAGEADELRPRRVLLRVPAGAGPVSLSVR